MQTKTDHRVYAGFIVRLAAYFFDWLCVSFILLVVRIPIWISSQVFPDNLLVRDFIFEYSLADLIIYLFTAAYFILLTYYTGATLGKRALHLRVVSAEERKMTFFEVVYRETVGKFLSGIIIGIGYLMILLDKKKRGIHDLLADTVVIYYHEKKVYMRTPVVYRDRQVPVHYYHAPQPAEQPAEQPMKQPTERPMGQPAEQPTQDSEM